MLSLLAVSLIDSHQTIALKLYGRHWKKVEQHVGTRTGTQIRSHAQKHFLKSCNKKAVSRTAVEHGIESGKIGTTAEPQPSPILLQSEPPQGVDIKKEEQKVVRDEANLGVTMLNPGLPLRSILQSQVPQQLCSLQSNNEHELDMLRRYTDSIMTRIGRSQELGALTDKLRLLSSLEQECNHINNTLYQLMPRIALGKFLWNL